MAWHENWLVRVAVAENPAKCGSHCGGRAIWQIHGSEELIVAWREGGEPKELEGALLREFSSHVGALPFANRQSARPSK